MSVFKVKLNNTKQGLLDQNPLTGSQFAASVQRTIYVAGPGRTYRKLKDGDQFTDCNYWKRFTSTIVGDEAAFIEVVTDDGSVYSYISFSLNRILCCRNYAKVVNLIVFIIVYSINRWRIFSLIII